MVVLAYFLGDFDGQLERTQRMFTGDVGLNILRRECKLLGYKPEPWRSEDVIMLSRMIGYLTLAQSQGEMERFLVELVQAGIDPQRISVWWHSHAKMSTFFSGEDEAQIERFAADANFII